MNVVVLRGVLSRAPSAKVLPSGAVLGRFEVTVREPRRAAETVPVVWFDAPAAALGWAPGCEVVVAGRVRRRFFRWRHGTGSRTEVVADCLLEASHHSRTLGLLDAVVATLTADDRSSV